MTISRASTESMWVEFVRQAEQLFVLNCRLPGRVSRLSPLEAPFFDGDVLLGEGGWPLVSSFARAHGDAVVSFLMVDPGGDQLVGAAGAYGAFTCGSTDLSDEYVTGLLGAPEAHASGQPLLVADTFVLFGASPTWGVWVERGMAGVVFSATPHLLGSWESLNQPLMRVDEALEDFLGANLGDSDAAALFADALRQNYAGTL